MKIDNLLERYFEGLTTTEDEATLRDFFTSDYVPENLMMYKPLFTHFDNEIKRQKTVVTGNLREENDAPASKANKSKKLILWLSGVAACVAMLTGFVFASQKNKCPRTGDYVIIDGRCYTDEATIRSATFKTLHEVAEDGDFLPDNRPSNVIDLVENQLKQFDFLLDE